MDRDVAHCSRLIPADDVDICIQVGSDEPPVKKRVLKTIRQLKCVADNIRANRRHVRWVHAYTHGSVDLAQISR